MVYLSLQQTVKAIQTFEEGIQQTKTLLDNTLQAFVSNMVDSVDANPQQDGSLSKDLANFRKKLEGYEQEATNFRSELQGYGISMEARSYATTNENTLEMLERMKHKGDAISLLHSLHNDIAQSILKQAHLHKQVVDLTEKVNQLKSNSSLDDLKRKMGLK
jgi:predicted  nucleic acid-binding Zn-ribbon protein